jgi:6-pyruvoyl-tetrahydropterin synthase
VNQTRIEKRVQFAAAHHLPGVPKCCNNHGHNWVANITVEQTHGELDEHGFIVDVGELKLAAYKYDHNDLNIFFEMPSTENVAQKIADDALAICVKNNPQATFIVSVHLIETENNSATCSATNFSWQVPTGLTPEEALAKEAAYSPGNALTQVAPPAANAKFVKRKS